MDGRRPIRIAEQIRHEVGSIISYELRDSRVGFVTVTDVEVTPDLRQARIFVTFLGSETERQDSLAALKHAAGFIRRELGARLRLRYTPQLQFLFDHSVERGARIEQLLSEEAAREPAADDPSAPGEPETQP